MKNKRSEKIKWAITGIAFVLAFIMLLGLFLQVFGTGKVKPSEWFNISTDKQASNSMDSIGGMIITPNATPDTAIKLTSAQVENDSVLTNADGEYESTTILTATIEPYMGTYPPFVWAVVWANADSEWATGKNVTDYVTVFSNTENTATVGCKQAFGEQIICSVSTTGFPNDELSEEKEYVATCTIDYKEKVIAASTLFYNRNMGLRITNATAPNSIVLFNLGNYSPTMYYQVGSVSSNSLSCRSSVHTIPINNFSLKCSVRISDIFMKKIGSYPGCPSVYSDIWTNPITNENVTVNGKYSEQFFDVLPDPYAFAFNGPRYTSNQKAYNGGIIGFLGTAFPCILNEFPDSTLSVGSRCVTALTSILAQFASFYADESIPAADKYVFTYKMEFTCDEETYVFEYKILPKYTLSVSNVSLSKDSVIF